MQLRRALLAVLGFAISLSAQIPDFTPPTPLIRAVMRNDAQEVDRLLAAGANPNEGRMIGAPPVLLALLQRNNQIAKSLIGKGADVKATDGAGSTTLMWAAATETGGPELVNELIQRGVDPNASNKMGENALLWAVRRGNADVIETLKRGGATDRPLVRQSVEKAITLLQKSAPEFVKVSGCSSCHNQSLPQMAWSLARERGFAVDAQISDKQVKSVIAMFRPYREQMLQGKENIPDPAISVTYSLLGLAAEKYSADETTEAMAHLISTQQTQDGSFLVLPGRPPIESSAFTATALSIRSMQLYGKNADAQVEKAREWLVSATPKSTEDRTMQLLGMVWTKAPVESIQAAARALVAEQRPDGGWGQLPTLETDAYATGQALYALHTAGQATTSDRTYQRGVAFLLRTQLADGSWLVRSRSFPFQPYKESGFPHGKNQWISAAGTSWAAMALSLTVPPTTQQLSQAF